MTRNNTSMPREKTYSDYRRQHTVIRKIIGKKARRKLGYRLWS